MASYSDNIKAVLFIDDFRQSAFIHRAKCMTIQQYNYELAKSRKDNGEVYEYATSGSIMEISLRVGSRDKMKPFYERTNDFVPSQYSVLFNCTFDEDDRLTDYDNAMIAEGFIIDIQEEYDVNAAAEGQQMLIHIKFLITGIRYMGEASDVKYNV